LIIRPFQPLIPSELEAIYKIIKAATRADWTHRVTHELLRSVLDPVHTTSVAWLDHRPAGFAWWEIQDGTLIFEGWVDPELRRHGAGTALLIQIERVARENKIAALRGTSYSDNPGAHALFALRGFQEIRRYDQMWVDLPGSTFDENLPLPPEITIHRYSEKLLPALMDAEHDAFRNHWGARPGGMTADQMRRRIADILDFDPGRFWLACEGSKVAAFVLSQPSPLNGSPDDSWIWHVGTRPDYQRMGLARILMHRALARLQRDGFLRTGLHVDSENPPAVALYESVGMRTLRQRIYYAKTL